MHIVRPALLLAVVGLTCAACSAGSSGGTTEPAATQNPSDGASSTAPEAPSSSGAAGAAGGEILGAAYRFTMPSDPPFAKVDEYVRAADGQHGMKWRWSPDGQSPYCYLHTVEQPNFPADFPRSAIGLFEASATSGDEILRNEVLSTPPPGAAAAVAQEMRSEVQAADGQRVVIRSIIREQLTAGGTLLQFISSAPEDRVESCHLTEMADSFIPTGREAPTDPPPPSPSATELTS